MVIGDTEYAVRDLTERGHPCPLSAGRENDVTVSAVGRDNCGHAS